MVKKNIITIKCKEAVRNYKIRSLDLICEVMAGKVPNEAVGEISQDLAHNLGTLLGEDKHKAFQRIKYLCQRGETPMFFNDEAFSLLVEADQDGHDLNVVVLSEDGSSLGLISNKDLLW